MLPKIEIKGIREGLLAVIGEGQWSDAEKALFQEIERKKEFFKGARLILDVENYILGASILGKLRDDLSDYGITLWAVLSSSPKTEANAQVLGMATKIHQASPENRNAGQDYELGKDEGVLIKRTLRSGNSIEFPGHITVIGDVNPGSEIIAGGNVVVWGKLKGMVHAGAEGDESAVVCALELSPTQLRIADKIAISPDMQDDPRPEIALIRDGQVVAELWKM